MSRLKDKVAIVTGSGVGIGKATGLAFADEGATVILAARNFPRLAEVAEDIKTKGGNAKAIQTDISDETQVKHMIAQTINEFGQIDILVNNAGTIRPSPIWEMSEETWDYLLDIHLKGSFNCIRHACVFMKEQKSA